METKEEPVRPKNNFLSFKPKKKVNVELEGEGSKPKQPKKEKKSLPSGYCMEVYVEEGPATAPTVEVGPSEPVKTEGVSASDFAPKIDEKSFKLQFSESPLNDFEVHMPYAPYDYQQASIESLIKSFVNNQKTILFESPTGTGKTQTLLTSILSYINWLTRQAKKSEHFHGEQTTIEIDKEPFKPPKILYFTRTTSQMNQVVSEIKKSSYRTKATVVASRSHLCLHAPVAQIHAASIKSACLEAQGAGSCTYSISAKFGKQYPSEALDIEDLRAIGAEKHICPYYLAKHSADSSDVIIMSYNYLVYPMYRGTIQNHINNGFIVFDEAHNLTKILEESGSWEFEINDLAKMIDEISKRILPALEKKKRFAISKAEAYLQSRTLEDFVKLLEIINFELRNFISNKPSRSFIDGAFTAEIFKFNEESKKVMKAVQDFCQDIKIKNIHNFNKQYLYLQMISEIDPKLLSNFFLHIDDDKHKVSCICVDPAICFSFILNFSPKAIILMSGTLSPFEVVEKQLRHTFASKFSIIPSKEKWIEKLGIVKIGSFFEFNGNKRIELNYKTRNEEITIKAFYNFLLGLLPCVPKGVLVFLASYGLLECYKTTFEKDSVLKNRIEKSKKVFFENKMQNFGPQFDEYKRACYSQNGGIFFLVFGGKFSEGIDFKDELARMVIILGIPFSNPQEVKLLAKRDYIEKTERAYRSKLHKARQELNSQLKDQERRQEAASSTEIPPEIPEESEPLPSDTSRPPRAEEPREDQIDVAVSDPLSEIPEPLNYSDWYFNEAFLQINQAAGRVKRSESDFGTILLVDGRFSDRRYEKFLSPLLRALEVKVSSSKELYIYLDDFYRKNIINAPQVDPKTDPIRLTSIKPEKKLPNAFSDPVPDDEERDCMVCYAKLNEKKKFLISKCKHIACETCWKKSLLTKLECMMCKAKVREKNLKELTPN